ncbi:hypothetical protein EF808_03230 [archaeon]|nr:MAG: hypothetical protein EF808_03230 [archaeon]
MATAYFFNDHIPVDYMQKTVIGSWPIFYADHGRDAIRMSVEDQAGAGADLVSDGQTRNYMVEYFSNLIQGYNCFECPIDFCNKDCGTGPVIIDRIDPDVVDDETVIEDLAYAVEISPRPVKGIITGPTTLVNCSRLDTDAYSSLYDEDLFTDLSDALVRIAKDMLDVGAHSIQIDEPFLSVGSPSHLAKYSIEYLCKRIPSDISLHVCGDVYKEIMDTITDEDRRVFDIVMGFRGVDSVSFSFAGYPQNKMVLGQYINGRPPKKIVVGCVRTDSERVETVNEVYNLLRYASWCAGEDNVIAAPDCGMKILSRDIAYRKLQVMCEAADKVASDLDHESSLVR